MAARFERWKGHAVLLHAARLLTAGSRIRIWIAGGPQHAAEAAYGQELADAAAGETLRHRVSLLGEREDVPTLMRLSDIYCQPNLKGEPFGIAIAEAMRSGLPCVLSGSGGAAELVDDSSGVRTLPGDAGAVADALQRLADDAPLRATMGEAARARAAQLTDPAGRLEELAEAMASRDE
jgi:glycosyltransferase involved in cell wall biosynthesis